jgi:hypothetical protein
MRQKHVSAISFNDLEDDANDSFWDKDLDD